MFVTEVGTRANPPHWRPLVSSPQFHPAWFQVHELFSKDLQFHNHLPRWSLLCISSSISCCATIAWCRRSKSNPAWSAVVGNHHSAAPAPWQSAPAPWLLNIPVSSERFLNFLVIKLIFATWSFLKDRGRDSWNLNFPWLTWIRN